MQTNELRGQIERRSSDYLCPWDVSLQTAFVIYVRTTALESALHWSSSVRWLSGRHTGQIASLGPINAANEALRYLYAPSDE